MSLFAGDVRLDQAKLNLNWTSALYACRKRSQRVFEVSVLEISIRDVDLLDGENHAHRIGAAIE